MAPRPLSNVHPEVRSFGLSAALLVKPQHAALVMSVIEHWSWADALINQMLSSFLKLDIAIATKMLQAVENTGTRRAVVKTAAKHVLSERDYELFEATLKSTASSERWRHAFAHHLFGVPIPDVYGDSILVVDPKLINRSLAHHKESEAIQSLVDPNHSVSPDNTWWTNIYLFTLEDLKEAVRDAHRAERVIRLLQGFVDTQDPAARNSIRDALSNEPRVRQELDNRLARKQRESPPS